MAVEAYKRPRLLVPRMQVFGVIGSGADVLVDRLADCLDGLAVIRGGRADGGLAAHDRLVGATTYDLSGQGWRAAGEELSLGAAIDRLAADHEYAAVVGVPKADLPQVVLDPGYNGATLYEASEPDAVDVDDLVERIDDLEPHETLESLVASVKRSPQADRAGAIATFTGRVRAKDDPDDSPTQYLEFEKYEEVADQRLRALETELEDRDGVFDVEMHHRTGVIPDGEDIVFVVVLAGHREEAFRTVEEGINRLKDEVPIFKKEVTTDEAFWVHERE